MNSIWDASFIVIDVETTGSHAEKNRIFEIACIRVENGEIVSEFSSLANPHQFIPPYIANMTGVSNEKVYAAPESHKVFSTVYELLTEKPCIFVAHNANFDFGFVRETMKRMNLSIDDVPVLCTLKLAKRLLPKNLKKNVGSLAEHFGHKMKKRHRAYDDTLATVTILNELLEIAEEEYDVFTIEDLLAFQNKPIKNFVSNSPAKDRINDKLLQLPRSPGVYYFYGKDNKILYVGKSKSLKERVSSYFSLGELSSKKISDLVKNIYDVSWQVVDTELESLLLESSEIKKHKPFFNSVQKKYRRYPFIKINEDDYACPALSRGKEDDTGVMFGPFRSASFVNEILLNIEKKFKLRKCTKKIVPDAGNRPCFYYQIDRCLAPCAALCTDDEYQAEVGRVKVYLSSLSDGIITQLETKMQEFSDNLEFEKAIMLKRQIYELKRTFLAFQNVGASISDNNMILVQLAKDSSRTADVYFIRSGKLSAFRSIGFKQSKNELINLARSTYFNGYIPPSKLSLEDIDEIRIVTSWIFRNLKQSTPVYVENKELSGIEKEINLVFDGFNKKEESPKDVYYFDDITPDTFSDPL